MRYSGFCKVVSFLNFFSATLQEGLPEPRIIGGSNVEDSRHPYFVYMWDGGLCGGALIAPDIVITAAHVGSHHMFQQTIGWPCCQMLLYRSSPYTFSYSAKKLTLKWLLENTICTPTKILKPSPLKRK